MLSKNEQIALAAKLLCLTLEDAEKYSGVISSNGALYVSVPLKGGESLIVHADGTVLYANSSMGYGKHLAEFESGKRTPFEFFQDVE